LPSSPLFPSTTLFRSPYLYPDYVGTRLRAPAKPLVRLPSGFHDFPAPLFPRPVADLDHDLTRQHGGEPIGERIIVTGRVLDSDRSEEHTSELQSLAYL